MEGKNLDKEFINSQKIQKDNIQKNIMWEQWFVV